MGTEVLVGVYVGVSVGVFVAVGTGTPGLSWLTAPDLRKPVCSTVIGKSGKKGVSALKFTRIATMIGCASSIRAQVSPVPGQPWA